MLDKLNFNVIRVPLITEGTQDGKFKDLRTRKQAVIREDNGHILGIVGTEYKLVHHKQALENFIDSIIDTTNYKISGIALPKMGARMIARIQFHDIKVQIDDETSLVPEIIIKNSMDGLERFGYWLGASNEAKSTVYVASESFTRKAKKHTKNLNVNRMGNEVNISLNLIKDSIFPRYKELAKDIVDVQAWVEEMKESKKLPTFLIEDSTKNIRGNVRTWDLYTEIMNYLTNDYILDKKSSIERAFQLSMDVSKVFGV